MWLACDAAFAPEVVDLAAFNERAHALRKEFRRRAKALRDEGDAAVARLEREFGVE